MSAMENEISISALAAAYARDRRDLEIPNYRREDLGSVVRYTPLDSRADGIVCFTRFSERELDSEIARHVEYFDQHGTGFEWKVYDFDSPPRLKERLLVQGFEAGEPESVMVRTVAGAQAQVKEEPNPIIMRRLEDEAALVEVVELQEMIWRRPLPWLLEHLRSIACRSAFFGAYLKGSLVGSGWIEYPPESQIAELHGGAVRSDLRGLGIYSRLFQARMQDASEWGINYIAVDAAPMSKAILERKGFVSLAETTPLRRKHRGARS